MIPCFSARDPSVLAEEVAPCKKIQRYRKMLAKLETAVKQTPKSYQIESLRDLVQRRKQSSGQSRVQSMQNVSILGGSLKTTPTPLLKIGMQPRLYILFED